MHRGAASWATPGQSCRDRVRGPRNEPPGCHGHPPDLRETKLQSVQSLNEMTGLGHTAESQIPPMHSQHWVHLFLSSFMEYKLSTLFNGTWARQSAVTEWRPHVRLCKSTCKDTWDMRNGKGKLQKNNKYSEGLAFFWTVYLYSSDLLACYCFSGIKKKQN